MKFKIYFFAFSFLAGLFIAASTSIQADEGKIEFTDVRSQAQEFLEYNKSITLTPEQEKIMKEALSSIPAPCCSDNPLSTCCCPCNMAKTSWGLSKYLITKLNYDAAQVKQKVEEWTKFINKDGFSGDVCYKGQCGQPWKHNGCGGMKEPVVF